MNNICTNIAYINLLNFIDRLKSIRHSQDNNISTNITYINFKFDC